MVEEIRGHDGFGRADGRLAAAASGGVEVPLETVERGVSYYKAMYCPGGGFGYTDPTARTTRGPESGCWCCA